MKMWTCPAAARKTIPTAIITRHPSACAFPTLTRPLKPFVELTYAPRFHDEKFDRNGLRRNSHGLTASVGVALDHGPIWSGEAALVYAVRDYEDSALATNEAIGINGNLTWSPTDLTSVVMTLATTLNESVLGHVFGNKNLVGPC